TVVNRDDVPSTSADRRGDRGGSGGRHLSFWCPGLRDGSEQCCTSVKKRPAIRDARDRRARAERSGGDAATSGGPREPASARSSSPLPTAGAGRVDQPPAADRGAATMWSRSSRVDTGSPPSQRATKA